MNRFGGMVLVALGLGSVLGSDPVRGQPVPSPSGVASVEFLDVGQGDPVLIRSPEGKTALVDAGPSHAVVPLLRSRGVTAIDMVVVTHHHADHYGGMEAVVRGFRPRLFLAAGSSHTSEYYLRLLHLGRDGGIQAVAPADAPRRIGLGSVVPTILPQPPESHRDENDNSIGLRVEYGTFSVLLTGDGEAGERAYWERVAPQLVRDCTVLKPAHDGSRNGTDARWLGLVRPRPAVASLGRGNEFGRPHPETLSLPPRYEVPLLRTDRDGTVAVVGDGKTWGEVVPRRSPRGPPVRDEQVAQAKARQREDAGRPRRLVDIDSASQVELESLPGVGPVIARRIVEGRPYGTVDDLLRVKRIGEKRMAELRPRVTSDEPPGGIE